MKLIDYMRERNIDDEAMAAMIGHCSVFAVRKWKYGEREPDASRMLRIRTVTDGVVDLSDWVDEASPRLRSRKRRGAA